MEKLVNVIFLVMMFVTTLAQDNVNPEFEYDYLENIDWKEQKTGIDEPIWSEIDDEISAREEEYHRHRRQILINRPVKTRERVDTDSSDTCPSKCTCQVPEDVHCTFRFLTEIPDNLPDTIEKLNLGFNKIVTVPSSAIENHSKTLRHLYLHSNDIRSLGNGVFAKMGEIQVLRLSWNRITGIRKTALHGLTKVERLYLDNNRLGFVHPLAFRGLTNLKLLQLNGNRLSRLHRDVFVTLDFQKYFKYSSIQYIYLADNQFNNLPQHIFDNMEELKSVYLHGNDWVCSCETKWMRVWMEDTKKYRCKRITKKSNAREDCPLCSSPSILKEKRMMDIPVENFTCVSPGGTLQNEAHYTDDFSSDILDWQNEIALFSYSNFYSIRMNIRLDSYKRSVLHASCNLTRIPVTTVKKVNRVLAYTTNDYYKASFEAQMQCFIEYPEDFDTLRKILNPYLDQEMNLTRRPTTERKLDDNQQLYLITVHDFNRRPTVPLTGASVYSSTEFIRSPASSIIFESDSINAKARSMYATFKTSFTHTDTPTVGQYSKKPWALIRQPTPTSVSVAIALERKTTMFKCKAVGQPKTKITWVTPRGQAVRSGTKNGKYSVSRSGRLIIRRPEPVDSGFHRCIATVPDTLKSKSTRFFLSAVAEISIVKILVFPKTEDAISVLATTATGIEMQTTEEGDNWSSPCKIQSFPSGAKGWITPNNQLVIDDGRDRNSRVIVTSEGRITVSNFTKSDQGVYRCVAANIAGSTDNFIYVGIRSKDGQYMQTIDQVTLEGAHPSKIPSNTDYRTRNKDNASDEIIDVILIPTEVLTEKQTTEIEPTIIKPIFQSGLPSSLTAIAGSYVELDCMAIGTPEPSYVWYFLNQTLGSAFVNGNIILAGSTLVIKNVGMEFEGSYRCIAENSAGVIQRTVDLYVSDSNKSIELSKLEKQNEELAEAFDITKIFSPQSVDPTSAIIVNVSTDVAAIDRSDTTDGVQLIETYPRRDNNNSIISSPNTSIDLESNPAPVSPKTKSQSSVTSDLDGDEVYISKYTRFLSTPASFDNSPVIVKPRTRVHRKEQFIQKPSTTQLPKRLTTTSIAAELAEKKQGFTQQITSKIKPTLFTNLRQSHAMNILTKLSNSDSVEDSLPNRQLLSTPTNPKPTIMMTDNHIIQNTPRKINDFDITVLTTLTNKITPATQLMTNVQIANHDSLDIQEQTNSSTSKQAVLPTPNKDRPSLPSNQEPTNSPGNRMKPAFVNKTITTADLTTLNIKARHRYQEVPAKRIGGPKQTPAQVFPTMNHDSYYYEPPLRVTRKLFKSANTAYRKYGETTLLPCLPPAREYLPMYRWTFIWTLPSGIVLKRPHQTSSADWRQFVHMNGSLLLRNLKTKDAGQYACIGSQRGHGSSIEYHSSITLIVWTQPPHIINSLREYIEIPFGRSITLPCDTEGNPNPRVTWRLPTRHTIPAGEWRGRTVVYKNGTLVLSNMRPEESGSYTCVATNDAGEKTRTVNVLVTSYSPQISGPRHRIVRVKTGGRAKLNCGASGHPKPRFLWLLPTDEEVRENQAVFKGSRYQAKYAAVLGGVLYVNNVNGEDAGRYYCFATNKYGQAVSTFILSVR